VEEQKISLILHFFNFSIHGTVGEFRKNSYCSVLGHPSEMNNIMEVDENETFKIKKRSSLDIDGSCSQFY
jgi:hypothetical protein